MFFSDCDAGIAEGIRTNNHLPFCHNEAVAYTNFLSTLVDDGDTNQVFFSRNDILALWDEYTGPTKPEGKLLFLDIYLNNQTAEILIFTIQDNHKHMCGALI